MNDVNGQDREGAESPMAERPVPDRLLAGFWRRLGADLVDVLALCFVGWALGTFFGDAFRRMGERALLVGLVISLGYYTLFHSAIGRGGTPGKRLLGIEVVSLDGRYLSPGRSLARALLPALLAYNSLYTALLGWLAPSLSSALAPLMTGALLFIAFSCYLQIPFHPWKRGLHDMVAGSVVVHRGAFDASRLAALRSTERERVLLFITAALAVFAMVASYAALHSPSTTPGRLFAAVEQVNQVPGLRRGGVNYTVTRFFSKGAETRHTVLTVSAELEQGDPGEPSSEALFARCFAIGREAALDFPDAEQIRVVLASGWSIGIWSQSAWVGRLQPLRQ